MRINSYFLYITLFCCSLFASETPQITIVLVIDQCAYRTLEKVRPFCKGGLRFFLDEGVNYHHTHVPYAWPSTAAGHATLNTGTLPKTHGVIGNKWNTENDTPVLCDQDDAERAAVFGPNGLQPYGKSAQYLMVDGISDQLMMQTQCHKKYKVFSVGLKSRSAICTAGKMGKAIWFDEQTGMFTSSKAYFDQLPTWIRSFNTTHPIRPYTWQLHHTCLPVAYRFCGIHDYSGCRAKGSLIGKTINIHAGTEKPYRDFVLTPRAHQMVFDCALSCLDAHFCKKNPDEKLFIWVLLGSLDRLGHVYGSNTIEMIDMMYHLDAQIKKFMDCVNAKTHKRNILWALTSDHGVSPTPEEMQKKGYSSARRIIGSDLVQQLNAHLNEQFELENIALHLQGTSLYINQPKLHTLTKKKQKKVTKAIKQFIKKQPGIKHVWTFDKLQKLYLEPDSIESYYKNQLYKGRSSEFIVQALPYNLITNHTDGTSHNDPYNYNTHIPLIIYQRAFHQRKIIHDKVYNTQLAPTLAHILGVPKPSACTAQILPGIIYQEDCCF